MNKPITVKVLVTVDDPAHFDACTLCFETLRVGWPTAEIKIYTNGTGSFQRILDKFVTCFTGDGNAFIHPSKPVHHAEWIRQQVSEGCLGPLVIVDPDTVFWKSCEDWEFPKTTLLAGYFNPPMWNDFAKCLSQPRIHTSLMVFPDVFKLWVAISDAYPLANIRHGEYCPCDPFMPAVRFENGGPLFWDSCANLYGMLLSLSRPTLHHFGEEEKACYDHLNSASFYDVMVARMEGAARQGFIYAHREWVKKPVPGLWPLVDNYYRQKAIEGAVSL